MTPTHQPIRFWNRAENREEVEAVYGEQLMQWLYGNPQGRTLADQVLTRHLPSRLYGMYQSSALSKHKIPAFIKSFKISMDEYEGEPFHSFNDFFIRRFKRGRREFVQTSSMMPAFAEARYLAYEKVSPNETYPVKGSALTPAVLLKDAELAKSFAGGALLIARLCPTDYHRYHYPDQGTTSKAFSVHGKLHSVNPHALKYRDEIFMTNERRISILETQNFGRLAYIEVGALFVGKIVQTHDESRPFGRGDEKGYFLFGASTVIVLGQPGAWKPDADLLFQTAQKRETYIKLGQSIASA